MRFDPSPPWGNLRPEEHLDGFACRRRVLDINLKEFPDRRVHRGIPELGRGHLTETLVAGHFDTSAGDPTDLGVTVLVRVCVKGLPPPTVIR